MRSYRLYFMPMLFHGKTYHARPNRDYKHWQFYLGYFDLYDDVFKEGTSALRKKYTLNITVIYIFFGAGKAII